MNEAGSFDIKVDVAEDTKVTVMVDKDIFQSHLIIDSLFLSLRSLTFSFCHAVVKGN